MKGRVTELAVAVENLDELERIAGDLRKELGPQYEVHTWQELQPFVRDIISRQRYVMGLICVILFVIIITGIINTMLMSVFERVREIGTMLAVGTRRWQVVSLFLLEGAVLGLVGGLVGALVGGAVTLWLGHRGIVLPAPGAQADSIIRPFVSGLYLVRAVGMATVGASLAALWPAYRAAKLRPVEALAHS